MIMRVSNDVLAVLDRAECLGNTLSLAPLGTLERTLYLATDKVLIAAGGKWDRRSRRHVFDGSASAAIEPVLLTGAVVSVRQEFGQLYTPPEVAARVIASARLKPGLRLLEPSAGRGALAAPALLAGCQVHCIELDERNVRRLCSTPYQAVIARDFLGIDPAPVYDRIVMNPPFGKGQDVRHVAHALGFLKPGGRLVAIMSTGITFRTRGADVALRDELQRRGAVIEPLEERAFASAGTAVSTCIVSFGGDRP